MDDPKQPKPEPVGTSDWLGRIASKDLTPLEISQACFVEWLVMVDGLLEDAQLHYEEACGAGQRRDIKAFGTALGKMVGQFDKARAEIKAGLEAGV